MPANDSAVYLLLSAFSLLCFGIAANSFSDRGRKDVRAISATVGGVLFLLLSLFWKHIEPTIGPDLASSIASWASDFRLWFAIFAAAWIYGAAVSVITLIQRDRLSAVIEDQIEPITRTLDRIVMPRMLSTAQRDTIIAYLQRFPPHAVHFEVHDNDTEANEFATDISLAFGSGGWTIGGWERKAEMAEGLRLDCNEAANLQRGDAVARPCAIANQALRAAVVRTDGGQHGNDTRITQDVLKFRVGAKRRDRTLLGLRRPD
jgi:hypothetical protein